MKGGSGRRSRINWDDYLPGIKDYNPDAGTEKTDRRWQSPADIASGVSEEAAREIVMEDEKALRERRKRAEGGKAANILTKRQTLMDEEDGGLFSVARRTLLGA